MISRENKVLTGFVVVALVLTYGGYSFTDVSTTVLLGTLLFVGTVAPLLVNNYLDTREVA